MLSLYQGTLETRKYPFKTGKSGVCLKHLTCPKSETSIPQQQFSVATDPNQHVWRLKTPVVPSSCQALKVLKTVMVPGFVE
jgi:hypothetical protein